MTAAAGVEGYLARLGLERPEAPTYEALVELQRRHLERVPYDNLEIMLGRPPSTDPAACLARIAETGRGGYCFHQNGALELVLRDLGYDVSRRHGHVFSEAEPDPDLALNHLVLVVGGLPTPANPGGEWWVDAGLGDGFLAPLPLVVGRHAQGAFAYVVEPLDGGWGLRVEPRGTFDGVRVDGRAAGEPEVAAGHRALSTRPTGRFTRLLVAARRDADGVSMVRGCTATRVTATTTTDRVLTTYDEWRAALATLGLPLDDVDEAELRRLHALMWTVHEAWQAAMARG